MAKTMAAGQKSARFDDPAKTKGRPREGSVTRKGREGPAARAAKTHRGDVLKRLLEKLADSTHHHLKGQKKKKVQVLNLWGEVKCPEEGKERCV